MRNIERIKDIIRFEQLALLLLKVEALENNQKVLSGVEAGKLFRSYDAIAPDGFKDLPGPCLIEIKYRVNMPILRSFIQRAFQAEQNWASILLVVNESSSKALRAEKALKKDYPQIEIKVYSKKDILELKNNHPEVWFELEDALDIGTISESRVPIHTYIDSLRYAFKNDQLVLFLGAGVSHSNGMPTWDELLRKLANLLIKKKKLETDIPKNDEEIISYLKDNFTDSRLIIARILRDALGDRFSDYVRKALYQAFTPNKSSSNLLEEIANLCIPQRGRQGLVAVVNYNYDDLLETELDKKGVNYFVIASEEDTPNPDELPIYHPHGLLPHKGKLTEKWRTSLVLSEDAYHSQFIDPYAWTNITQLNFLRNYVCLFIGLSMLDPNLRRLLEISQLKKPGLRHYAILKDHWKSTKKTNPIVEKLGNFFKNLEERTLNRLGVSVLWVDDYDKIPNILENIRR